MLAQGATSRHRVTNGGTGLFEVNQVGWRRAAERSTIGCCGRLAISACDQKGDAENADDPEAQIKHPRADVQVERSGGIFFQ